MGSRADIIYVLLGIIVLIIPFILNKRVSDKNNFTKISYHSDDSSKGRVYVRLRRGSKTYLEKDNKVFKKDALICELPDELKYVNGKDLMWKKVKYKRGDGATPYRDLPYEEGVIPVAFYIYI